MIIPDGDIIVTSLTLNGSRKPVASRERAQKRSRCFVLLHRAGAVSCQHPKECSPLFHRQLRATFTRPLINSASPFRMDEKKKKNSRSSRCSLQMFSMKTRRSLNHLFAFSILHFKKFSYRPKKNRVQGYPKIRDRIFH